MAYNSFRATQFRVCHLAPGLQNAPLLPARLLGIFASCRDEAGLQENWMLRSEQSSSRGDCPIQEKAHAEVAVRRSEPRSSDWNGSWRAYSSYVAVMRPRRTCNSWHTPKQVALGIHGCQHSRQRCVVHAGAPLVLYCLRGRLHHVFRIQPRATRPSDWQ